MKTSPQFPVEEEFWSSDFPSCCKVSGGYRRDCKLHSFETKSWTINDNNLFSSL